MPSAVSVSNRPCRSDYFRFGDVGVELISEDSAFLNRFSLLFGENSVASLPAPPRISCCVTVDSIGDRRISFAADDRESTDLDGLALELFSDRGYYRDATGDGEVIIRDRLGNSYRFEPGTVCASPSSQYQSIFGNLLIALALSLQPDAAFFHGASVGVGERATFLLGRKGVGKSTLALGMAARGHLCWGDEIAGVRFADRRVIPVRRAASVRPGPAGAEARAVLGASALYDELYPDGSVRKRVPIGRVFPDSVGDPAILDTIVFLEGWSGTASLEPLNDPRAVLARLPVMRASLWGSARPDRLAGLLRLAGSVDSFTLRMTDPDSTIELLESFLEI